MSEMMGSDHPDYWLKEIKRLKRRVSNLYTQEDLVVFYGSSSIRLWVRMRQDLYPFNVLNMGFGGSTFYWCSYYFEELFENINPKEIILYGGDNDLSNNSIEKAEEDLTSLLNKINAKYGHIKLSLISVKPSPERVYLEDQILKFNSMLKNKANKLENGHFINIHSLMLDSEGKANPKLYLSDQLHMNRKGYEIWRNSLMNHLKKKKI